MCVGARISSFSYASKRCLKDAHRVRCAALRESANIHTCPPLFGVNLGGWPIRSGNSISSYSMISARILTMVTPDCSARVYDSRIATHPTWRALFTHRFNALCAKRREHANHCSANTYRWLAQLVPGCSHDFQTHVGGLGMRGFVAHCYASKRRVIFCVSFRCVVRRESMRIGQMLFGVNPGRTVATLIRNSKCNDRRSECRINFWAIM